MENCTLAISDLQIPFEHQDALDFVIHVEKTFCKGAEKIEIVNVGDEFDQHTLRGKSLPDPDGMSGGDEFKIAKERIKPWFDRWPKTKVCISNHTWRVFKRAHDVGIPSHFMKSIPIAYDIPTWEYRDRWCLDGIVFEHGEHVSGPAAALNAATQNRMSTVIGHQHSHGGVIHSGSFHNTIWGLNTGCLIDVDKYAFAYGRAFRKKPTLGMGIILGRVPLFIPMILNKNKRWVGYLV